MTYKPTPPRTKGMRIVRVTPLTTAILIAALTEGTRTFQELAEHTGLHYNTVRDYCHALHKHKVIHITEWQQDAKGRDALRIYLLGPGTDAKRKALTPAQRGKRSRHNKRQLAQQAALTFVPTPALAVCT